MFAVLDASRRSPVLAVDIPSGVNGATGAVARRRRCARHETICFAAYKPGLLFEPGRDACGPGDGGRHRYRVDATGRSWPCYDVTDLALPSRGADVAQVVGRLPRGRRIERHGRRAAARGHAPRCVRGAGMVVCAVPGRGCGRAGVGPGARRARVARDRRRRGSSEDAAEAVLKDVGRVTAHSRSAPASAAIRERRRRSAASSPKPTSRW